jgi:uncharacterized protein YdeI (YjbR/CyaY-like superfamily)
MSKSDLKPVSFQSQGEWARWLAKNQAKSGGLWLRFFKKDSGVQSVTYPEALDEALCHGWIDGLLKTYDSKSWVRRFTPRRPRSLWSKRNIEHVERLTKAGRMKPGGLREVEAAKADGRWDSAYDPHSSMALPGDFLKELSKNKKARRFFDTLNKANRYAIAWRLQTARKAETRARRMKQILLMLARGRSFHAMRTRHD